MLAYGARMMDPILGRFINPDPLSELAPDWTPYRYAFNNPIIYIDPDGMFETEAAAKKYAEDNNIKTGWFSRTFGSGSKIVENKVDGKTSTWSIDNKKKASSTFQDNTLVDEAHPDGVFTAPMVAANDVMSSKTEGGGFDIFKDYKVTETLRDGTERDATPLTGVAPGAGRGDGVFKALRSLKGLEIGKGISTKNAIERLKSGKDVFSSTKELAKKLRKKASNGGKVIKDKAHGGKGSGYRDHYHDADRALDSHSFFGKPK